MALTTYSELQTAVASELRRTDLTTYIPDFIKRAESKINRKLRGREQEDLYTWTYTTGASDKFLTMPSGFVELLTLEIKGSSEDDSQYQRLQYEPPETFLRWYDAAGEPERYTLRNKIELNRLPGASYSVRMHYLKQWAIATDLTNWLLTNYPDVYLYGALAESMLYLKNDPRVIVWKSYFEEAIAELNEMDERSRNDAELRTDEYSSWYDSRHGYRITTDRY